MHTVAQNWAIRLRLQTEGEVESSEQPGAWGHGAADCEAGGDETGEAGSSEGETFTSCLTGISGGSSGSAVGVFEAFLNASAILNLLDLTLFVSSLVRKLDLELRIDPSDCLALRSRLSPMVSVSRGFFTERVNIIHISLLKKRKRKEREKKER
jgi:hypothetical protein